MIGSWGSSGPPHRPPNDRCKPEQMGGTYDPPERNDDQNDDLKAGEEVSPFLCSGFLLLTCDLRVLERPEIDVGKTYTGLVVI